MRRWAERVDSWTGRVDWCHAVAVPVVTLTALLDPVDTLNGAIQHIGQRLAGQKRTEPTDERAWSDTDVVGPALTDSHSPRGRRPPGGRAASRGGRFRVRP